jgi:hypothetical protein
MHPSTLHALLSGRILGGLAANPELVNLKTIHGDRQSYAEELVNYADSLAWLAMMASNRRFRRPATKRGRKRARK